MSLIAINPSVTKEYSLTKDTSEDKTVFVLGVIDSFVRAHIDDTHMQLKNEKGVIDDVAIHHKYLDFVRFGLRGWRNLKGADGKEVPFTTSEQNVPRIGKYTVVSDESMKALDLSWVIELGIEITLMNRLSEQDQKNS